MVSTRGVKFKFTEGERVLCYEPDPTKAKVLYESKVLELVVTRDTRGRKTPEYLVHFQGWNSSWDRCVGEDFVLQDTPENRSLQRKLAQDAALNLCVHTVKGKKRRKLPAIFKDSFIKKKCFSPDKDDNSNDSAGSSDTGDEDDVESSEGTEDGEPEEESDEGGNHFSEIKLSDKLKEKLEDDGIYISSKNKLLKLPCEPNIINLLESYVKQLSVNLLCTASNAKGTRLPQEIRKSLPADIEGKINLSKELVDGIRVFFDFTLPLTLLYKEERQQYENIDILPIPDISNFVPPVSSFLPTVKKEPEEGDSKLTKEICQESLPWHSFHPVSNPSSPSAPKTNSSQFPFPAAPAPLPVPIPVSPKPSQSRQRHSSCRNSSFDSSIKLSAPSQPASGANCYSSSKNNVTASASSVATMRTRTWARSQSILKNNHSLNNNLDDDNQQSPSTSRRILRSSLDKARIVPTVDSPKLEASSLKLPGTDHQLPDLVSSSVGSSSNSPPPLLSPTKNDPLKQVVTGQGAQLKPGSPSPVKTLTGLQNCLSPPLPPSSVSSSASSTHSDSTMQTRQTAQDDSHKSNHLRDPSGLLNKVLSWQMLPPAVVKKKPMPPSLIYGPQHLLRLFVKLPDYLERMSIPKSKRAALSKGLQCFLKYIEERCEELFRPSSYKDVDDLKNYLDIKKENVT